MIKLQHYVLCLVYNPTTRLAVFVLKNRPAWQAGKINLPGGKVELGETPEQAVIREINEELGIDLTEEKQSQPTLMGQIVGKGGVIWCFKADSSKTQVIPRDEETEYFFWEELDLVRIDHRCLPNLKLIVPLMHKEVTKWVIRDENPDINIRPYTVEIALEDN
jgi:8-oxo-dGTP pyrophosphatase MutT (NUDIX family)